MVPETAAALISSADFVSPQHSLITKGLSLHHSVSPCNILDIAGVKCVYGTKKPVSIFDHYRTKDFMPFQN